jgi:hypothetical protein
MAAVEVMAAESAGSAAHRPAAARTRGFGIQRERGDHERDGDGPLHVSKDSTAAPAGIIARHDMVNRRA